MADDDAVAVQPDEDGSSAYLTFYGPCEREHAIIAEQKVRSFNVEGWGSSASDGMGPIAELKIACADGSIVQLLVLKPVALRLAKTIQGKMRGVN